MWKVPTRAAFSIGRHRHKMLGARRSIPNGVGMSLPLDRRAVFHSSATRFVFHRTLPHTARCVREHGRAWERNLLNGIPRASACHQGYGHNAQATLPTRLIRPRAPECAPHPICLSDSAVTFFVGYVVTVAREAVRRYTRFSALHP